MIVHILAGVVSISVVIGLVYCGPVEVRVKVKAGRKNS